MAFVAPNVANAQLRNSLPAVPPNASPCTTAAVAAKRAKRTRDHDAVTSLTEQGEAACFAVTAALAAAPANAGAMAHAPAWAMQMNQNTLLMLQRLMDRMDRVDRRMDRVEALTANRLCTDALDVLTPVFNVARQPLPVPYPATTLALQQMTIVELRALHQYYYGHPGVNNGVALRARVSSAIGLDRR